MTRVDRPRVRWDLLRHDVQFWGGLGLALVGLLGIQLGKPSFAYLLFFGGLCLGIAAGRAAWAAPAAADDSHVGQTG